MASQSRPDPDKGVDYSRNFGEFLRNNMSPEQQKRTEQKAGQLSEKFDKIMENLCLESVPVILGIVMGGLAKATNHPEAIIALPFLDTLTSRDPINYGHIQDYAKYFAGAAIPYLPEICQCVRGLI